MYVPILECIIYQTYIKGKSTFHKACKEGQSDVVETIHLIVYLILFGAPGFYNSVTSIHYVVFLKLTQVAKQQQDFKGEIRRKSLVSRQLRWHKKHKLVKRKIKITKGKEVEVLEKYVELYVADFQTFHARRPSD